MGAKGNAGVEKIGTRRWNEIGKCERNQISFAYCLHGAHSGFMEEILLPFVLLFVPQTMHTSQIT